MKIFKTMFLSTLAIILAVFLVGQALIAYQQNRSTFSKATNTISKAADKTIDVGVESYKAVASFVKGQM